MLVLDGNPLLQICRPKPIDRVICSCDAPISKERRGTVWGIQCQQQRDRVRNMIWKKKSSSTNDSTHGMTHDNHLRRTRERKEKRQMMTTLCARRDANKGTSHAECNHSRTMLVETQYLHQKQKLLLANPMKKYRTRDWKDYQMIV